MTNLGILNRMGRENPRALSIQSRESSLELLLQKIKENNALFRDMAYCLAELLSSHKDLVEKLLKGEISLTETLDEKDVTNKGHDTSAVILKYTTAYYERLGILHLFRGELYQAHHQFLQAQRNTVAASILRAYYIFQSAYSQIKL